MTKERAIKEVQSLLDRLPEVAGKPRFSEEFKVWKHDAIATLKHIFTNSPAYAQEFADIGYDTRISTNDSIRDRFFQSGLLNAKAMLQSRLNEITRFWVDEIPTAKAPQGSKVFIGHGGSPDWRDLKDFLQDRLKLEWDEFNREPVAGIHTAARLQQMLDQASFAFLVMTAEDERADGTKHARENVIHEIGLFQGRLGFNRAIILLEHGCKEFSNIVGLTQIRFSSGKIKAEFEEIRRVLEREGLLKA